MSGSAYRTAAPALLSYGIVATACWFFTRAYASEDGGTTLWGLALVTSIGHIACGTALLVARARFERIVLGYLALALAVFLLLGVVLRPSAASAFGAVSSAGLLLLHWGRVGQGRRIAGYALLGLCTLALVVGSGRKLLRPPWPDAPRVVFEVMKVDEDVNPFGNAAALPEGASIETETVDGRQERYLRLSTSAHVGVAPLARDGNAWVKEHAAIPPGVRVAWSRLPEEPGMVVRSYFLREPAVLGSADVETVEVVTDRETKGVNLAVTLSGPAGERLREVTRQSIGRRLAILFDGVVQMAPIVRSEITGGRVTITLGRETTREEAEGLAAGLRGELRRGP